MMVQLLTVCDDMVKRGDRVDPCPPQDLWACLGRLTGELSRYLEVDDTSHG